MLTTPLITAVAATLNDTAHTRWTTAHLAEYLTDALRALATVRPQAFEETREVALAAGSLQEIPADAVAILGVVRNVGGASITPADRAHLDLYDPDWHLTPSPVIDHWFPDPKTPRRYYVASPALAGTEIEVQIAVRPSVIAAPGQGQEWPEIDLDPVYEAPLRDWMLYRAYAMDSDAGLPARAVAYRTAFYQQFGLGVPDGD